MEPNKLNRRLEKKSTVVVRIIKTDAMFLSICIVVIFSFINNLENKVACLETKYFKRFYFGNLSMDLSDQLSERFPNYDYQKQSPNNNNNNNPLSPYHTIHVKQSVSPMFHIHNTHSNNNYMTNTDLLNNHHTNNPHHSPQQLQADQPSQNNSSENNNNNGGNNPPSSPPPPPHRHQDLKALSRNITNILNSFNVSYDKRVRPNYGGEAVEVGITMFVLSISDLSEVEMDFTLDFYFRQMWKDHRLTFQGPKGVNTLSVSSEFLKSMWVPDTFFVNEKTSYFHTATTNNEFLRISQTGDILRSMRLTVCASCPMDLRHFPMDSQLCNIEIESFGYTMSDIRYKWAAGPGSVGMAHDVSLPQFKVFGYRQKTYEISLSTGNYSRLACEIQFVRSMGYYLIQIYIPSSLIVVISWVSFWLNRNAAPARVYLGITTVLTMTTLMSSTNKALPKISYVKSIDVYLGTCFVMVFAALLEYATVGYLAKRIQMRKNHFAALQKMALQLQTAREEHVQKQYPPQPITPHHHHIQQTPQTPSHHQVPRYNAEHPQHHYPPTTPTSSHHHPHHQQRFMESSASTNTLRKYGSSSNNNAQSQQQQQPQANNQAQQQQQQILGPPNNLISNVPPAYYNNRPYDQRYYEATNTAAAAAAAQQQQPYGVIGHQNSIPPPGAYANNQQQFYNQTYYNQQQQQSWNESGGSCSRAASVKRRGNQQQQQQQQQSDDYGNVMMGGIPPSLLQQSLVAQQAQNVYSGGGGGVLQPPQQFQQQQQQVYGGGSIVGSVIGTTVGSGMEQIQGQQHGGHAHAHHHHHHHQQQQQHHQQQHHHQSSSSSVVVVQQQQQQGGGGGQQQQQVVSQQQGQDKIRQLIPINPNQICGITPSDIDKYSRVVFPVCFVCFNLLYWIIYLHISNVNPTTDLVLVSQDS